MKQQGVSYSVNYIFTCGNRRMRICRNIYDQTNKIGYLVDEEGSNASFVQGGDKQSQFSNYDSQKVCTKMGVNEGCKNENIRRGYKWFISSQKKLLSVQQGGSKLGCEINRTEEEDVQNKMRGSCVANQDGIVHNNQKNCQCLKCTNYSNQSPLNSSGKKQNNSTTTSSSSSSSTYNIRLISDFYLHKASELNGIQESHLILRVEDTFQELEDIDNNNNNSSDLNNSKVYAFNHKILNGFLFKQTGLYIQFNNNSNAQTPSPIETKDTPYYPNSTELTLKNDNFTFQFLINQTEEGFSVDGSLLACSPLVQTQVQLAYKVNVLQQEQSNEYSINNNKIQKMNDLTSINQESSLLVLPPSSPSPADKNKNNKNELHSDSKKMQLMNRSSGDEQKHKHTDDTQDDEDTQCSSQTVQINNNDKQHYTDHRNEIITSDLKQTSNKKILKLANSANTRNNTNRNCFESSPQTSSHSQNQTQQEEEQEFDIVQKKQTNKRQFRSNNSLEDYEYLGQLNNSSKLTPHSKSSYSNDEAMKNEMDKQYDDSQNSWASHSKDSDYQDQSRNQLKSQKKEHDSNQNMSVPAQPKKNVVKNFVKAFRNFVNIWGDETRIKQALGISTQEQLQNFRLEYKKYENSHKFNNTFIQALILNEPFKPVFNYFVNEEAWEWLDKSQVNNKKSHKDVLRDYIKATQDPSKMEEIHSLRTRNRQNSKKLKQ